MIADSHLNKCLYVLSRGLLVATKNQIVSNYILTQIQANEDKFITFDLLITNYPTIENTIDSVLSSYSSWIDGIDSYNELVPTMVHEDISYEPTITLPNYEVATANVKPIIAPGFELYDDEDSTSGKDDVIACFQFNNSFEEHTFEMWESIALEETDPIFIVGINNPTYGTNPGDYPNTFSDSFPHFNDTAYAAKTDPVGNPFIQINQVKFTKSHDKSFRNEVAVNGYTLLIINENLTNQQKTIKANQNAFSHYGTGNNISSLKNFERILKLKKTDLNKDITVDFVGSDLNLYAFINFNITAGTVPSDPRGIFNSYERDWYSNPKALGKTTYFTQTYELTKGRMKFNSDFYIFDPNSQLPGMDFDYLFANSHKDYLAPTGSSVAGSKIRMRKKNL